MILTEDFSRLREVMRRKTCMMKNLKMNTLTDSPEYGFLISQNGFSSIRTYCVLNVFGFFLISMGRTDVMIMMFLMTQKTTDKHSFNCIHSR
jgi:hypothetical protein